MCKRTRDLCIKLVIINKLYYDARPTKYQDQSKHVAKHSVNIQVAYKLPEEVRKPFPSNIGLRFSPRDGSRDCRNIPNVTFTVCNPYEFHDLATLPAQVMA